MKRTAAACVAAGLAVMACAAMAAAQDVTILAAFPGNHGPGWKETIDVAGAVGPKHVVDFDEGGFVVHDKATGRELQRFSPGEFWLKVEPAGTLNPQKNPNDMRILYDPLAERWYAAAADNREGKCYLAVSTSSDPTQPWKGTTLPLPPTDPYMKLGFDKNGFYVCSYNGNKDPAQAMNCYAVPKSDIIAPGGPATTRGQTFTKLRMATMPAVDLNPDKAAGAPEVLLVNEFDNPPTCGKLFLYKIAWAGQTAGISEAQAIPLGKTYHTRGAGGQRMEVVQPAPGQKLRADGGRRIESVFVRGGSVFGCNGAKRTPDSRPGVLWYEVRISDGALLQEGFVDSPDCDYIYPTLAVDGKGNVGIGCTRTSEKDFPSVCVMMRAATDPPNTMRAPVVALPGTTAYHYAGVAAVNLSHYTSTCVDPANPDVLWTYQMYGNSDVDRRWCTGWAAFKLAPAAAPMKPAAKEEEKPIPGANGKVVKVDQDTLTVNGYVRYGDQPGSLSFAIAPETKVVISLVTNAATKPGTMEDVKPGKNVYVQFRPSEGGKTPVATTITVFPDDNKILAY